MAYDLAQLRAFLMVVETGSVGRAAGRLNITQPALSRMIRKLEARVGEEVFDRHPSGMRLTAIGEALLPYAGAIKQGEEAAQKEIETLRGLSAGTLRIGVVASASAMVLPEKLCSFQAKWPGLSVEVVEGVQDQLCNALVNYEIDLVLSAGMPDMESVAEVSGCGWNERASVIAAPHNPIVRVPSPTLNALISLPWAFMPKGTAPYARWSSQFIRAGLKVPRLAVATTSISLIKTLVRSGQFVSWLMEPMFREEHERGALCTVDVSGLTNTLQMRVLRRREGRLPLPAVRFLDELRAV